MILNQLLLICNEGLIFAIFAFGIYLSFQWLKFPDLTPDGSFLIGACIYVKSAGIGVNPLFSILVATLSGSFCGIITACLNRFIKIPTFISGVLMSVALYSIGWLLLGKPNQFLDYKLTLVGDSVGIKYNFELLCYLIPIIGAITIFIILFYNSIWGLRIRAIGENSNISHKITKNNTLYYFLLLAISNGIVATSGALFLQRSYSVDINMGMGQTIVGLTIMIIGMLLSYPTRKISIILLLIILGSILYKGIMFATLEFGLPAELFRLGSSLILIIVFFIMRASSLNVLKGLKWN